jgi:serine protease Do
LILMKPTVLLLIALAGLSAADEARTHPAPVDPAATAETRVIPGSDKALWLGVDLGRLDQATRAHVPKLPVGIGFVVTLVDPGSPAEKAGLKPYDIFWKLGDQWIANTAQLETLIRLHEEGDEVVLGVYRSGMELAIPVVLARMPEEHLLGKLPPLDPSAGRVAAAELPMKVFNPADGTASTVAADGTATLSLVDGIAGVKIESSSGTVIYEGPVNDPDGVSLVPDPWKPRVAALERGLARPTGGNLVPRPPRLRNPAAEVPAEK